MRKCYRCKVTELEVDFGSQRNKCKACKRDDYKKKHSKVCLECKKTFVANREYCSMSCAIIGKTVKNESGCWNWTGAKDKNGYGFIKQYNTRKMTKTHRASYQLFKEEIPEGMHVCHSCDNPSCCNPDHLWLGDNQANINDAYQKGRIKKLEYNGIGSKNGCSKLVEEQVLEIRKLYNDGLSQEKISKMFGVSQVLISGIVRMVTWKHVKEDYGRL